MKKSSLLMLLGMGALGMFSAGNRQSSTGSAPQGYNNCPAENVPQRAVAQAQKVVEQATPTRNKGRHFASAFGWGGVSPKEYGMMLQRTGRQKWTKSKRS